MSETNPNTVPANPENPNPAPNPPAKPAGDSPKPPETPTVPEKYELKLKDGSPLDPKDLDKIAAIARQQGLSQEQAVTLLSHHEEFATGLEARQTEAFNTLKQQWSDEVKADKELGGDNWSATLKNTKAAMDRFAPESSEFGKAFREMLIETGYTNHPMWVRFVNSIGKALAEDGPRAPGDPPGTTEGPKDLAEALYGKSA